MSEIKVRCGSCFKEHMFNPDTEHFPTLKIDSRDGTLYYHCLCRAKPVIAVKMHNGLGMGIWTQFFILSTNTSGEDQMASSVKLSKSDEDFLKIIRKMHVHQRAAHWIKTREQIRQKKVAGRAFPWSEDPILNNYRFCNVRRMDDKVSQWLINNWYDPHRGHRNIPVAAATARIFNNPEALDKITRLIFSPAEINWEKIQTILQDHRDQGNTIFNGAYIVSTAGATGDKLEFVIKKYLKPFRLKPDTDSMQHTWKMIKRNFGFASFMSGQVVADLRHAEHGLWLDRKTWAPAGPGSLRGLNRFFSRDIGHSITAGRFQEEFGEFMQTMEDHTSKQFVTRLEAMDFQNCLCEFDKYERTLFGEGRPKQLYAVPEPKSDFGTRHATRKRKPTK